MKQVKGRIDPREKPEKAIEVLESMKDGEQLFYMTPTQEFTYTTTFVSIKREGESWTLWRQKRGEFGGRNYVPVHFKTSKEVISWMIENNASIEENELLISDIKF